MGNCFGCHRHHHHSHHHHGHHHHGHHETVYVYNPPPNTQPYYPPPNSYGQPGSQNGPYIMNKHCC